MKPKSRNRRSVASSDLRKDVTLLHHPIKCDNLRHLCHFIVLTDVSRLSCNERATSAPSFGRICTNFGVDHFLNFEFGFDFFASKLAACYIPPSRDNPPRVSYPRSARAQQQYQGATCSGSSQNSAFTLSATKPSKAKMSR